MHTATAVCNQRFTPNAAAEFCFKNKQVCQKRYALLTGPERQALGMLKYPPELDKWGRQAFDYTDDVSAHARCCIALHMPRGR